MSRRSCERLELGFGSRRGGREGKGRVRVLMFGMGVR